MEARRHTQKLPVDESALGNFDEGGLFDALADGVVIVDRQGTIRFVNRRATDLFGYERGALVGGSVELLLPESRRLVHRAHRLRYSAEPHVRAMGPGLDLWGRRADGAEFPLEISLSPWRNAEGEYFVAVVRDVSARHASEAELRGVYTMLDQVAEAVYLVDCDSLLFRYVNAGAVKQTGYSRADLMTMTPVHLIADLDRAGFEDQVAPLLADVGTIEFTALLRTSLGEDLPVECRIEAPTPLRGGPACYVAIVRDLTDRLAREDARVAASQWAALVEDRERIARDLHDSVVQDLFATGLALQGVAMRVGSEPAAKIADAVDQLDRAIREVRMAIFSLSLRRPSDSLVAGLNSLVAESARSLGFHPSLRVNGPIETVVEGALADQVVAVLREALSNVARHAQARRADVEISVDGRQLVLRITDDGVGIATGPGSGGHGLHNMTVRAEAVSGLCTIEPNPNGGTCITWTAPIAETPAS